MNNDQLRTMQRAFLNVGQDLLALERVFRGIVDHMVGIEDRLERLDGKRDPVPVVAHFDGSAGNIPPASHIKPAGGR